MGHSGSRDSEAQAREQIDGILAQAGWIVQDRQDMNLQAGQGVAIREFALKRGHGFADYLLFVEEQAVGVLEAKKEGFTLSGVEVQALKYSEGLPDVLRCPARPLPFLYRSTGAETVFTNLLDPEPRSRGVFSVHRPETMKEWMSAKPTEAPPDVRLVQPTPLEVRPSTLRGRLRKLPPLVTGDLYANQVKAIQGIENSLKQDKPRTLIQMATGSGKTLMAVASIDRLVRFAQARRVLFLVDRSILGEQAATEFEGYVAPDLNRRVAELYNIQRLTSNTIGASTKVVITTIQRLYSMLTGDEVFDPVLEQESLFQTGAPALKAPAPVAYDAKLPPEFFDCIFIDECHRSIYTLWRQVLEYFDAYLIGLTATPAKHTFGFFKGNVVMEYGHAEAVADRVNVDFDVYRLSTRITEQGSTIEAVSGVTVGHRDRRSRRVRWETPDEDLTYGADNLDRDVVAEDQIRLLFRTLVEKVVPEVFPGRKELPKTLVFAKDDSHAEDIVRIIRESLGKGDEFCRKITYKTTGVSPTQLIQVFRNSFNPRIAVTVDLVATGTDVKPIEIVMFMRVVRSRVLFDQMKGRGVRVIDPTELRQVTPSAHAKTSFLIVDCVGATEQELVDTRPLDRKKTIPFKALLQHVAMGGTDPDMLSSLASRLARLDKQLTAEEQAGVAREAEGTRLGKICHGIVEALDPDMQEAAAREKFQLPADQEPTEEQLVQAATALTKDAVKVLARNPRVRDLLCFLQVQHEQLIDQVSQDELLLDGSGLSYDATQRARSLTESFQQFLEENRAEISALEFFYSIPHRQRLSYEDLKGLAEMIKAPPRSWTPDALWHAYQLLEKDKVRGAGGQRMLTDLVSLVRYALHQDDELVPHAERVQARFSNWLAQQANRGRGFTPEQVRWLEMIRDHVAASWEVQVEDFEEVPFVQQGGLGRALQVFGKDLGPILQELNEVLAA